MKNLKHVLHRVFIMTVIITTVFSLAHFPVLPVQATVGGDSDGDGIIDASDNCPDVSNPDQADADGDGLGDVCDETPYGPDADGDGYGAVVDNCPDVANPDQADYDGDGPGDACDDTPYGHDLDEDGLGALVDNCPDVANPEQADADWDGTGDACDETPNGHDNDQDGLPALFDNCPDVANADQTDADSDGVGDVCDLMPYGHDDDGDGIPALHDNCPDVANSNQADVDGDLTGDVCDSTPYGCDPDGDGIGALYDNCPDHSNPDQADLDGDGQGNVCDLDDDSDGVTDPNDNCPLLANPGQTDSDRDGVGDACDADCSNPNCGRIDRSSLEVTGRCTADGALFTIRNTGEPGRGDMVAPTEWRLIQGDVVVRRGPVQLRGGETMDVLFSGSGEVTLEADQQIGHPGHSHPRETLNCTVEPTEEPTIEPTVEPTEEPTEEPTAAPTEEPTVEPTEEPTAEPTEEPTVEPTVEPTEEPMVEPTEEPTAAPTEEPTVEPTVEPTEEPTVEPSGEAGPEPTAEATLEAVQEDIPPVYQVSLPELSFESEGGAVPTPEIEVSDPALSKIGYLEAGAAGLVGEHLTWVVTARNVGSVPEINVIVTDPINPNLQIESVITEPGHTYTIVGNTVQVTIPLLNPGEVVNFYVNTIGIAGSLPISNTATANTGETANATVNLPPINPNPQVSLNAPPEVFLGDNFTFSVTFDNADNNDTGYGPFIDVIVPSQGADGATGANDGITVTGATYLGQPAITTILTFPDDDGAGPGTTGCVDHPLAVDNNHQPLRVCGTAEDTLLVIQLPFGSFAPDQPPATVTVNATMSGDADLGVPLNIRARGGFVYGTDPLDNWCCDPVIASQPSAVGNTWTPVAPVTPILWELSKTYNGPEGETATGPNYPRSYTVTADIANSQTMTDVCITDRLPNNIVVTGVSGISPAGTVTAPAAFPYGPVNGGVITVCFPTVASGSASFDINYYVPEFDANGASILNPLTGDDVITQNFSEGEGDWDPTDPRDPVVPNDTVGGVCTPPCEGNTTFTDKSIATQKSGAVVGGVPIRSGAVLEYTIVFQISDYFTIGDIVLTDIVSDGQRLDATFTPTITVSDRVQTLTGNLTTWNTTNPAATCADANAAGANVIVDTSEIGNDPNPATDGSTRLVFCISEAILDLGGADGILQGGRTQGATGGAATGTITYRTVVQDQFSDTYPSGDPSVDHGDTLRNDVVIAGTVRDNTNITVITDPETDTTGAQMNIAQGTLVKSIYAVNGSTTFAVPVQVSPGDTVTYRIQYTMPSTDFEDFTITDYLPLPVFHVDDPNADDVAGPAWVFQDVTGGAVPAAGFAHYGPTDTFRAHCAVIGGGTCILPDTGGATPTVTLNTVDNSLAFFFGDFDDPGNQDTTIDILFTVTVNDDPFADRLYLTNQARSSEGSTNAGSQLVDSIVQITLNEPVMQIRKGITDTDNPNELFAPALVAPFPVNNADLNNGNAYNANVSGVDGQDTVEFAIVLRNVGHSGAFDLDVTDTLPAGLVIPAGGMNLTIRRGDGSALSWDPLNAAGVPLGAPGTLPENLFTNGIRIVDPLAPTGPVLQHVDATAGRNIAIITYELAISPTVTPGQVIPNVAALTRYTGAPGGPNHLDTAGPLTDDATTTITGWNVPVKSITETSEAHTGETLPNAADATIGEIVRYRLAVQVPEGTAPNFTMRDTLSTGVSLLDVNQVRISFVADMADMNASALTPAENAGANNDAIPPTFVLPAGRISFAGQDVIFSLGDLVNNDNDATGPNANEYVVIEFNALVENVAGNDLGAVRANVFSVQTGPTPTTAATSNTVNVTLVEPQMTVTKTADDVAPAGYDAGDVVTYTITVANPAGANRAAAFNVALTDVIPGGVTYVPGSVALGACAVAPTAGPTEAGGTITVAWDQLTGFPVGASCAITFQVTLNYTLAPAQVVTNTANLTWTSLPGTGTPTGPDNQTGSVTPGASGAANGERNGSGGVNDYAASDSLNLTIDSPTAAKSITRTSEAHTVTANPEPVAVGEILRYRLYTSIPEGTLANVTLFDTLAAGLALLDQDEVRVSFVADNDVTEAVDLAGADNDANPPSFVLPAGRITVAGQNVTFDLGTLVNNDSDAGLEYVILEFNVLVLNSAATNLGVILNNTYEVRINSVTRATSNVAAAVVVEPVLTVAKLPDGGDFDAGDVVTFTVTVNAPAGANRSTAFNVLVTDALDPASYALNLGSVAVVAATGGVAGVTNTSAGNTVSFTVDTFPVGGQLQITYQATLTGSVTPGQIDNTAVVTWTSLPGTGTPDGSGGNNTGSTTPGGSGAANGERNGTNPIVAPNDHTATDSGYVTVSVTPEKLIRVTSEAHTTLAANGLTANAAIGEIIRYRLVSRISEGTIPNLQFADALPAGLQFLNDGTAMVAFVSNGFGVTSSTITPAGTGCTGGANPALVLVGSEANVATLIPECPLPGAAITGGPFGSGTDPTFNLGDILDDDRDADAEYIIVEFNALVLNEAGNQNAVARQNTFAVWTAGVSRATSNTTTVTVVEPVLSVVKSAAPATGDAGDTITFTITVNHAPTSTADAFDVVITDVIPADMTYAGGLTAGAGDPLPTVSNVGATYTFSYASVLLGAASLPYTFSFNVTLNNTVTVGQTITNTANLTWTSLPGGGTPNGAGGNTTGSTTPGASGSPTGERNGTTAPLLVNDHAAGEGEVITVVGPYETLKEIAATSEAHTSEAASPRPVAVGEILRYQLVTDIPEGTSVNVQLVDQMAVGLQMLQDATVTVQFISQNGITPVTYPALAGANTAPVTLAAGTHYTVAGTFATGELVTFNLGTLINTDTDTTAGVGGNVEQVVVEFNVIVVNDAVNDLGDIYANDYDLNVGGTLRDSSNVVNAVVVEPVLTVNKTATPNYGDDNDVITFTLTVTHPGGANTATAFDAELTDILPAGMTYQAGSLAHIAGIAPAALIDTGAPTLVVRWATPFNAGDSSTIRLNAIIDPGATLGQTFTNTARVTWTSLPGTGTPSGSGGNTTGSTTPGASGAVNGERTGSGGTNDHAVTGSAAVTVSVAVEKSIALTSEADTPGSSVAIGEVVRYRLSFALNNNTTFNNFSISDTLSTGVSILDLNEVRVSLINLTGDITAPADLMPANNDALPPTVQLPPARINVVGQNVTFDLGNLVNTDADADTEYVVVEFNALIEDVTGNFMGRVIANDFTVSANGGVVAVSDAVNVTLVGPEITLSKRNLTGGEPVGRGQTLLFEIALEHTAASTAAAHNIVITDSLPLTGAVFGALDPTTTCAGVTTGTAPNAITFTVPRLALGSRCIIRYTAQVSDSATHGMTYTNTAQAVYSSVSAAGMGRILTTNAASASFQVAVAEFATFPLGLSGSTGQPDQPGEGAPAPSAPSGGTGGMTWAGVPACPDICVPWIVYHTDRTGDWEIFRLDLEGGMGEDPNLSHGLGTGVNDFAPSRSPNGEWIVFTSNRDGNWEIYAAPTDGDEDRVQRITFNTVAIDTDPVWGPGNYVVYESTRDGNWELYLVDMATGATERLTANAASDINPFWSPDGSRLVFQSDRSGQWQIYELDLATRAVILLSDGRGVDVDPQYSNGGGQIVFRSYRDGRANSVLYLMGARGGNVEPISDPAGDATNAAWSPDDSLIAYQSDLDGDLDIYIYEVASRQTRLLTDNAIPDYAPTWKCDTNQVIFTSDITGNPDIFRAEARPISAPPILVEEDADQLTHTDSDDIYPQNSPAEENASREGRLPPQDILGEQTIFLTPDVSFTEPDLSIELGAGWEQPINGCSLATCEDWLVYHTNRTGDWEIFRLNGLAGGAADELDLSQGVGPDWTDKAPSLSPDRDWIAFASNRDGNWEIYVAATDGAQQRRVVFNPATDTDPVWSPIGNTVIYESDRDGNWNLYLLDLLTGVETRLTDDPGSDLNPFWAPDGVRVAFQSDRDGRWQIYELDLRTGETTRLSDGAGNDADPVYSFGGHRILFRSSRDGAESVIYLMNDDGSNLTRISDPAGVASNHTWSEDDALIAYQSDLDGDLDIYVYEVSSGITRLVTGNAIPDYAPTWYCAAQDVVFTSDVTDDPNLFMTPALPIDESPIDVASQARQLTDSSFADLYPQNTPLEENASRLGDLP